MITTKQNKIRTSRGEGIFNVTNIILMALLMVLIVIPLLHVVAASFSNPIQYIMHQGILLYPQGFTLDAYRSVLQNKNILTGYQNTIFIVVVGTSLNLIFTMVAAYVLSRKDVMFGRFLNLFIVFTMYFSGGMIPFYLVVKGVGLYNSTWALILPSLVNVFNLIVMRTAMAGVPESLEESAKLDGANHTIILTRIVIPLVKPTIAVICLYYAVAHWNSWFNAMLFMKDRTKYPLQLVLREILILNDTTNMTSGAVEDNYLLSETIQFATIVVATLPVLCLYPFIQKYFVKGVMVGAVKE